MAQRDKFYKSLDEHKRSRGSCNCWSLALLMLIVVMVAELLLFYIGRGVRMEPEDVTAGKIDYTEAEFARLEADADIEIIVTEAILCSKISRARAQANLKCRISEDGILISGKIATFLPANASLEVWPVAQSGRLEFQYKAVRIGQFKTAGFFAPTMAGAVNEAVAADLAPLRVDKVDLSEGIMVVGGRRVSDG